MSVQAVMRPSALPLPKTTSSQSLATSSPSSYVDSNRKCMVPVAVDRNRRAGSTPTRSTAVGSAGSISSSIIRTASIRQKSGNSDKSSNSDKSTISAGSTRRTTTKTNGESNKENNKAKDTTKSKIINNNNNNNNRTKGWFCIIF